MQVDVSTDSVGDEYLLTSSLPERHTAARWSCQLAQDVSRHSIVLVGMSLATARTTYDIPEAHWIAQVHFSSGTQH